MVYICTHVKVDVWGQAFWYVFAFVESPIAMNLPGLPFPASDLGWDKLDEVMDYTKLSRKEACTVIALVKGQPSKDTKYEPIVRVF